MNKTDVVFDFEQFPPKTKRILTKTVRDYDRTRKQSGTDSTIHDKELAHALLYMRLYQQFGTHQSAIIPDICRLFEQHVEQVA